MEKDPVTGFLQPANNYALTGFDGEKKTRFLELYKELQGIRRACKALGVGYTTLYQAVQLDPAFAAAIKEVKRETAEELESDMVTRGKNGSFMHSIAWLRANFPEKWGNKTVISHQKGGEAVEGMAGALDSGEFGDVIDVEVVQDGPQPGQGSK